MVSHFYVFKIIKPFRKSTFREYSEILVVEMNYLLLSSINSTKLICKFHSNNGWLTINLLGLKNHSVWTLEVTDEKENKQVQLQVSCTVVSNSLRFHGLQPVAVLCLWNSPRKYTGVGWISYLTCPSLFLKLWQ